jgi:hypothetical protein
MKTVPHMNNLPYNHYGESLDTSPDFLLMKKMHQDNVEYLQLCGEDVTFETPLLENIPSIRLESKDDLMIERDLNLITETKPTQIDEKNVL